MISQKVPMLWRILLALVLIVGIGFRFYNLDKKVFWMDEATSALRVAGYTTPEMFAEMAQPRLWSPYEILRFQRLNEGHGLAQSLRSLAVDDPKHPPLFYALLRIWTGIFGDSVFAMRLLPAVLSLLTFPAMWWLCRELFDEEENWQLIAVIAVALLALSPFHVLYAQEAREYSLWTAVLLVSSALFLRALRLGNLHSWILYAFALGLGLYTHTISLLIWMAHGAYLLSLALQQRKTGERWFVAGKSNLLPFAGACAFAVLLFSPWAFLIWQRKAELNDNTAWISAPSSPWYVIKTWVLIFSTLYFDPDNTQRWGQSSSAVIVFAARILRGVIFVLLLYALATVWRRASRKVALYVCLMAIIPFATLALPDLLLGGYRSTIGRFLIPSYLAVQIAVAYLIAEKLATPQTRRGWTAVLGLLIVSGGVSCLLSSQAKIWWNKTASSDMPTVSRIINMQARPLVVIGADRSTLSLCRLLSSKARLYIVLEGKETKFDVNQLVTRHKHASIFFYRPSEPLHAVLKEQGTVLRKADVRYDLWRLN